MRLVARTFAVLVLVPFLAGCAGGWRGGAPPAEWAAGAATTSVPVSVGTPASGATGTHAIADGAVFVWKGEGNAVNVAGEFNAWSTSSDALKKQPDGSWLLEKKLAPGRYAYKFVIDGGNWKPDPGVTEGVDDGFGGKNSLVVVGEGGATAPAAPPASPAAAPAKGAAPAVTAGGVVFRFTGAASTVHLAGEFNSWSTSADAMTKSADGSFTLTKALAPGRYAYKFVLDGTNWKEDPNAAESVDDGYGGKNSVVVVGEGAAAPAAAAPAAQAAPAAPAKGAGPAATAAGVVFRFTGAASTVHLAGEFNSWSTSADAMTKSADGSFAITKALAPGRYAYKFVLDGTNWKEDPNAAESVDDGYGGKNSVVVVGEGAGVAAPTAPAPQAAAPENAAAKPLAVGAKPRAPQVTAAGVVFTYAGPAKTGVALCGDFNAWATTADRMTQGADGTWTVTRKLAAGTHAYKFLVDGATWKTDEGNPQGKDDGFGGKNSIVVVK